MGRGLPLSLSIVLVVVALITVVVGFYAHLDSDWLKWRDNEKDKKESYGGDGLHNFCDHYDDKKEIMAELPEHCPDISLEQAFLALAVVCFLGIIASEMLLAFLNNGENKNKALNLVNEILQVVLALLILIGAILFIVSAVQAQDIYDLMFDDGDSFLSLHGGRSGKSEETTSPSESEPDKSQTLRRRERPTRELPTLEMRFEAKLVAAAFGIIQAILHAVAAFRMMRGPGNNQFQMYPQQSVVQPYLKATNQGQGAEPKSVTPQAQVSP